MSLEGKREKEKEKCSSLDRLFPSQEDDAGSGFESGSKGKRARAPLGCLVSKNILPFKWESLICIFISNLITAELINSPTVTKEIYFCMKLIMVNI